MILEKGNVTEPNNQYIVTIMKNVEALGYTFSKELNKLGFKTRIGRNCDTGTLSITVLEEPEEVK